MTEGSSTDETDVPKEQWEVELTFVRRTILRYRVAADSDESAVIQARAQANETTVTLSGKVIDDMVVLDAYHAKLIEHE